jgi:DNA repair protein RadC
LAASASSLGPDDRPREKFTRVGAGGLGDNELLALVLGHGTPATSALELANTLLARAGGARGLLRLTEVELCQVSGVGPARAAQILAALELGRRTVIPEMAERLQFKAPRDLALWLVPQFGAHPVEQFGIVLLDTKYRWLATRIISSGALDRSPAPPRDVFREAVAVRAAFVVVFHNHPSGEASPSEEDAALTLHLSEAAELLGIGLLDHLILTATGYFSFKERSEDDHRSVLRLRRDRDAGAGGHQHSR